MNLTDKSPYRKIFTEIWCTACHIDFASGIGEVLSSVTNYMTHVAMSIARHGNRPLICAIPLDYVCSHSCSPNLFVTRKMAIRAPGQAFMTSRPRWHPSSSCSTSCFLWDHSVRTSMPSYSTVEFGIRQTVWNNSPICNTCHDSIQSYFDCPILSRSCIDRLCRKYDLRLRINIRTETPAGTCWNQRKHVHTASWQLVAYFYKRVLNCHDEIAVITR